MSDDNRWGPGEAARKAKAFDRVMVGDQVVELIHGDHPHSRSNNTTYARFPNGQVEGFSGHRILWGVQVQEFNFLKESGLSGNDVREGGTGLIFVGGVQVYEFFFRQIEGALLKARSIIAKLEDLPVQIWSEKDRERLVGRSVYYYNHPATISRLILDQGAVILKADPPPFPSPPWREAGDDEDSDNVKDDILSPHIWWFREPKEGRAKR